jgi:hypothetical protein
MPDTWRSRVACWVCRYWRETEEFNNAVPVFVGGSVLVLFPLLDGGIADPEPEQFGQLRHGQLHVDPLFAKMLAQRSGCCRVAA